MRTSFKHILKNVFYCAVKQRVWVTYCEDFIFQHFTVKCISIVRVYLSEEEGQTHTSKSSPLEQRNFHHFFPHHKLPYGVNFGSKFNTTGEHKLPTCLLFLCWWNVIWCSCRKPIRGRVRRRRDQEEDVSRKEKQTSPTTKHQATLCAAVITTEHT